MKYILTRDVTIDECSWLSDNFKKGDIVYYYSGFTYGCCSSRGLPFTMEDGKTPFFELPKDSVEKLQLPNSN